MQIVDTEIYPNYFLFAAENVETGKQTTFEAKGRLSESQRVKLLDFMRKNETVGFNSNGFDLPIIFAAIQGYSVKGIKNLADTIIVGGMKPWEVRDAFDITIPKIKHIDLIEVAPGKASLKVYNGRLHGQRMQDLPYEPDRVLSNDEIDEVYDYCVNSDIPATKRLFIRLKEELDLRRSMSTEYSLDLMSKSDAQVAEAIINSEVSRLIGKRVSKPKLKDHSGFYYKTPDFINFSTSKLKNLLKKIERHRFIITATGKVELPKWLKEEKIVIGNSEYQFGIGGLHSKETSQTYLSDDKYQLSDHDVVSFYPRIIITQGLHPKSMGWAFQRVYERIVDRRIAAKTKLQELIKAKSKDKHEIERLNVIQGSLKICINGSFGKFGSPYSTLYAPNLLIQTTITGQLSLLMLIEEMEANGIPVISANTDGVVVYCKRSMLKVRNAVLKWWEKETDFETEETIYSGLYSMNVNSYIAIGENGKVKSKGLLSIGDLRTNNTNEICIEAIIEFIKNKTPLLKTILECKDIRKFTTIQKVVGGAVKDDEYLGKVIRFYHSTSTKSAIVRFKPTKAGVRNKIPKSEGARPAMDLPDKFPDDVDYNWYAKETLSMLYKTGYFGNIF